MRPRTATALAAIAIALAACGGGSGGGGDTADVAAAPSGDAGGSVDSGAFASVDAFMAFVRQLVASAADETSEPLALPDGPAPTTDTAEPSA